MTTVNLSNQITLIYKDTSIITTLSTVPKIALVYKATSEIRTPLIRTLLSVPMVSTIEKFYCYYYNGNVPYCSFDIAHVQWMSLLYSLLYSPFGQF